MFTRFVHLQNNPNIIRIIILELSTTENFYKSLDPSKKRRQS